MNNLGSVNGPLQLPQEVHVVGKKPSSENKISFLEGAKKLFKKISDLVHQLKTPDHKIKDAKMDGLKQSSNLEDLDPDLKGVLNILDEVQKIFKNYDFNNLNQLPDKSDISYKEALQKCINSSNPDLKTSLEFLVKSFDSLEKAIEKLESFKNNTPETKDSPRIQSNLNQILQNTENLDNLLNEKIEEGLQRSNRASNSNSTTTSETTQTYNDLAITKDISDPTITETPTLTPAESPETKDYDEVAVFFSSVYLCILSEILFTVAKSKSLQNLMSNEVEVSFLKTYCATAETSSAITLASGLTQAQAEFKQALVSCIAGAISVAAAVTPLVARTQFGPKAYEAKYGNVGPDGNFKGGSLEKTITDQKTTMTTLDGKIKSTDEKIKLLEGKEGMSVSAKDQKPADAQLTPQELKKKQEDIEKLQKELQQAKNEKANLQEQINVNETDLNKGRTVSGREKFIHDYVEEKCGVGVTQLINQVISSGSGAATHLISFQSTKKKAHIDALKTLVDAAMQLIQKCYTGEDRAQNNLASDIKEAFELLKAIANTLKQISLFRG